MSWYDYGAKPYVPVEQQRRKALLEVAKRRRAGEMIDPVEIKGRPIAETAWGKAWCDHFESLHDYETRLPRGRSYVRNGLVIDLQIAPCRVAALVSGSEIYRVKIEIGALSKPAWRAIRADCAGQIESLIELLQGRLSKAVMERLCRQEQGLFPRPSDIRFSCSCPDYAGMCKHVAAVLYGVGARLDAQPELLFRLRDVEAAELIAEAGTAVPGAAASGSAGPSPNRILGESDVAALFGIDIAASAASDAEAPPIRPRRGGGKKAAQTETANVGRSQGRAAKTGSLAKSTSRPASAKAARQAASSQPPADKPVKWWLKPKPAKPPGAGGPARRRRG